MLRGLLGDGSIASTLKLGLDDSTSRIAGIANRVANAATPGFEDIAPFSEDGIETPEPVDLEREMVALADESIRFDAQARLLRMSYDMIRVSMRQG
ncbi:MAG: hypothetical protein MJB57_04890 [Gemmatimonadetes bacterium]|nr:hypothetical protein [Gemmatimonadota bacterium]